MDHILITDTLISKYEQIHPFMKLSKMHEYVFECTDIKNILFNFVSDTKHVSKHD